MYSAVTKTYTEAATVAQPGLCCPKDYMEEWTSHIPKEAFDFNYGCGSPVLKADIREGEQVLDLGSGVGIDCFVAAKMVGPKGKVIGVDMTDKMLTRAESYQRQVSRELEYENVRFIKGQIENIPLPGKSVDVVLSNCVINLSPDKTAVFSDIQRVLKDGGRVIISDIVSDREVAKEHKEDETLWGGCYTGALTVSEFIAAFESAGFIGITQISESSWEEVAGYRFASLTICAYKAIKGDRCLYAGQMAIYLGPYSSVTDDNGHTFERFSPVEICTDTAAQLVSGPYSDQFVVTPQIRRSRSDTTSCCATTSSCGC